MWPGSGALDVDLEKFRGRAPDADAPRNMEDSAGACTRARQFRRVVEFPEDHLRAPFGKRRDRAARIAPHGPSLPQQALGDLASDESGGTCDQDRRTVSHAPSKSRRRARATTLAHPPQALHILMHTRALQGTTTLPDATTPKPRAPAPRPGFRNY